MADQVGSGEVSVDRRRWRRRPSRRTRLWLVLVGALLVQAAALLGGLGWFGWREARAGDQADSHRDAETAVRAVNNALAQLSLVAAHVASGAPDPASELHWFDLELWLDAAGQPVVARRFDGDQRTARPLDPAITRHLLQRPALSGRHRAAQPTTGILTLPDGDCWLLAAQPVRESGRPAGGVVLLGQRLAGRLAARLADQAGRPVAAKPVEDASVPVDVRAELNAAGPAPLVVTRRQATVLTSYAVLAGLDGRPALCLVTSTPARHLVLLRQRLQTVAIALAGLAVLCVVAVQWACQRLLWRPLALVAEYLRAATPGDAAAPPPVTGDDALAAACTAAGDLLAATAQELRRRAARTEELQVSQEVLQAQNRVLAGLARDPLVWSGDLSQALPRLTEAMAAATGVERCGIWLSEGPDGSLRCADLYHRETDRHTRGEVVPGDLAAYEATMDDELLVAVDDTTTDPRVAGIYDSYCRPLGIGAMLDAPIRIGDRQLGVICHEHVGGPHHWSYDDWAMARAIAAQVALVLQAAEERQAEAELRSSEQRHRAYVTSFPGGIIVLDSAGRIVESNDEVTARTGITGEVCRGRHFTLLLPPEVHGQALEWFETLRRLGRHSGEFVYCTADGGEGFVEVTAVSLDADRFLGFLVEVTDRVRAIHALQDSMAELRELYQAMTEAVVVHEIVYDARGLPSDYRILSANPAFTSATGVSVRNAVGALASQLYGTGTAPYLETYARVAHTGEPVRFETYFEPLDRHFSVTVFSPVAGRFATVTSDITAHRRAVEALRESEAAYRALTEHSDDLVARFDTDCRIVYISPAVRLLSDRTPQSCHGLTIGEAALASDAEAALVETELRRVFRTGERLVNTIEMTGPRGKLLLDWRLFPEFSPDGAVQTVLSTARDITAFKHAQDERERLAEQVRQASKMEALGQLAGGVAHDFNNLLTTIIGYIDLAREAPGMSTMGAEDLQTARRAADRAAALTRQLLAFSRRQLADPRVLDLNEVVSSMQKMLCRLLSEGIELTCALHPQPCVVLMDPGQVEQVLMNLVVNSRAAMPQGGCITIRTQRADLSAADLAAAPDLAPGPYARLAVEDTGVGMSEATRMRVFEPFFTTKPAGEGTGLGLATVYGIVRQNAGHITVDSAPGRGTVFGIYLPLAAEAPLPVATAPGRTPDLRGTETILLVEDEDSVRTLSRRLLEAQGYHVAEAANGPAAIRIADDLDGQFDLLLTDVVMPSMSGAELADRLRARWPQIGVLFVSGYPESIISEQGVVRPDIDFLPKPFSPTGLIERVRQALDRRDGGG